MPWPVPFMCRSPIIERNPLPMTAPPKRRLSLALLFVLAFCGIGAAHANDKVVLRLNFTPWAMHAQYYAGVAQGFYAAEGIDLEIRPPSGGQGNEVLVGSGREQFGITNVDSFVKARANGIPVVAIMADEPDTPVSVITLKSAGITQPSQLKGKKIAWFQANAKAQLDPLLKAGGLTRDDIQYVMVSRGSEVQLVAAKQLDALYGYSFGQGLTLEDKGFPVNIMALKDYGLKNYGTLVYTNETLLKTDPDLARRFLRATLKALIWTHDHMREAVSYVVKVAPDRDLDLETRKLGIIYGLYAVPDYAERFGHMTDAKWQTTIDVFREDVTTPPKPQDLYTDQFVDQLDEAKQLAALLRKPATN